MRLTSPGISANAPITKTSEPPVVPLKSGDIGPVGARRAAVELIDVIDPRCKLEVVPRDLRLPCRGRWLVLVVVGFAAKALASPSGFAPLRPICLMSPRAPPAPYSLQIEEDAGG